MQANTLQWFMVRERRAKWFLALCLRLASLVLLAAFSLSVEAGRLHRIDDEYVLQTWENSDGLPQNSVASIVQTPDGYLWLATYNGLVRFDGLNLRVFNVANTPEMVSDNSTHLYVDSRGVLWVAQVGGWVLRYAEGRIRTLLVGDPTRSGDVATICEDEHSGLVVASRNGLYALEGDHFQELNLPDGESVPVAGMCRDAKGRLFVSCGQGLFHVLGRTLTAQTPRIPASFLAPHRESGLWAGSPEAGLVHWTENGLTPYPGLAGFKFEAILQTHDGNLWASGGNRGLLRLNLQDHQMVEFLEPADLLRGAIVSFWEDTDGNLWLGSNGHGLYRLRRSLVRSITTRQGLTSDDVVALFEDRQRRLWIGGFGIDTAFFRDGRIFPAPWPADHDAAVSFCEDREGGLWVGGWSGHVRRYNDDQWISFDRVGKGGGRVVFEDRSGGVWLGSKESGVECIRNGQSTWYGVAQGLTHPYVTAIAEDNEGGIWVGTRDGLNRILEGRTTGYREKEGLPGHGIHSLFADPQGSLWIGTAGWGLSRYKKGRFTTVTSKDGFVNDVIAQILEDGTGRFYLGSNSGLMILRRDQLEKYLDGETNHLDVTTLGKSDGIANPEFAGSYQPSCCKLSDGRLAFGTVGGAVLLSPDRLGTLDSGLRVHVESVIADGKSLWNNARQTNQAPHLYVPAGSQRVEIRFAALNYTSADRVQFRFRLTGLDPDFVQVGDRRFALFTRLQPGEYDFQVGARNPSGEWVRAEEEVRLTWMPAWWQTLWARFALVCLLLGTGGGLVWTRNIRRFQRELELAEQRHITQRAQELAAANAQLQGRTKELEEALSHVRTLHGLIPICASCKKIRDDKGYWNRVEKYIEEHSQARFTHGMCPDCAAKWFPQSVSQQQNSGNTTKEPPKS